jgi:hypothetical protein
VETLVLLLKVCGIFFLAVGVFVALLRLLNTTRSDWVLWSFSFVRRGAPVVLVAVHRWLSMWWSSHRGIVPADYRSTTDCNFGTLQLRTTGHSE